LIINCWSKNVKYIILKIITIMILALPACGGGSNNTDAGGGTASVTKYDAPPKKISVIPYQE